MLFEEMKKNYCEENYKKNTHTHTKTKQNKTIEDIHMQMKT